MRERRAKNYEEHLKALRLAVEQRKDLWAALCEFVRLNGGWVVSQPGTKQMRIEISRSSPLPAKLTQAGYAPRHINTGTRAQDGKFMPVDIISIDLPGK